LRSCARYLPWRHRRRDSGCGDYCLTIKMTVGWTLNEAWVTCWSLNFLCSINQFSSVKQSVFSFKQLVSWFNSLLLHSIKEVSIPLN
jgi:hypothetical protein